MSQILKDMTIDEISLVDEPANSDARVVIVKAKSKSKPASSASEELDPKEVENDGDEDDAEGKPMKKSGDSRQASSGGNPVNPDAAFSAAASIEEFHMDFEVLSKALEDAEAKMAALEKRAIDAETALTEAQDVIKSKDEQIAEISKAAVNPEEEVLKSLPESIRKRLEEADAAKQAAEEAVTKMREQAETQEAIAKAADIKVGKPEEIGPLLLRVAKGRTTAEDATLIENVLKAAGEQGKVAALFKSMGSDTAVEGDPASMLQAKADEIHKAADGKLTKEQAYAKAMDAHPELYTQFVNKRRSA